MYRRLLHHPVMHRDITRLFYLPVFAMTVKTLWEFAKTNTGLQFLNSIAVIHLRFVDFVVESSFLMHGHGFLERLPGQYGTHLTLLRLEVSC